MHSNYRKFIWSMKRLVNAIHKNNFIKFCGIDAILKEFEADIFRAIIFIIYDSDSDKHNDQFVSVEIQWSLQLVT